MRISRDQTESNFPDNLLNDENEIKKTVGETFNDVRGGNIRVVSSGTKENFRKSTWMVNGALRENDWSSHYFVDPLNCIMKLRDECYMEHRHRKSTRVIRTISELEKNNYICNYLSFNITGWEEAGNKGDERIILFFFDEFERLFEMNEDIRSNFLCILRATRNSIENFVIQTIVVIGTYSILYTNSQKTSPFNIKVLVRNPNFTLGQVRALFKDFGEDNKMDFEQQIIEDIFIQTNGHAAFVCLCGRAIEDNLIRILDNERILSYEIWERYKVRSLMDTIVMYPTFRNMVQSLRVKSTDAEYLADEGVLVRGEVVGSFKLSSPLVRWLILQHVIPAVFPSFPPFLRCYFSGSLSSIQVVKLPVNLTGQCQHKYSNVIDMPYGQRIVLELLATASNVDLNEYFQWALQYADLLSAHETWIVHITCEDRYINHPHWPSISQLKRNLNVAHFYHDTLFSRIELIAGWWNFSKHEICFSNEAIISSRLLTIFKYTVYIIEF
ncbi:P-loop containing nucleoside triphosphate hydrolase protein [Rhizophagus irregularis DAOM 181602=DAOM 197198]|nr:P-loop containing nucleoside triphosphate hydrolase protein [Rhizophagus irregularis DAOM 181602=DAOM 197198]